MALNWDISKCHDHESLQSDDEWYLTEAVIWMTMVVDLGRITVTNAVEFATRVRIYERQFGPSVRKRDESGVMQPYEITLADIERRVGLSTNVTDKTRPQWLKRFATLVEGDVKAERIQEAAA